MLCCGVGELIRESVGGITSATIREATLALSTMQRKLCRKFETSWTPHEYSQLPVGVKVHFELLSSRVHCSILTASVYGKVNENLKLH